MSRTGSHIYYQFPVGMLAIYPDWQWRINAIENYAIYERGLSFIRANSREEVERVKALQATKVTPWKGHNNHNEPVLCGMHSVNLIGGTVEHIAQSWKTSDELLNGHCRAIVRVHQDIVREVMKGEGLKLVEFAHLCGLLSIIGSRMFPVRVVRDYIRARAHGWASHEGLFHEKGKLLGKLTDHGKAKVQQRPDKTPPSTLEATRYVLDCLDARDFFMRCTIQKRLTYFCLGSDRTKFDAIMVNMQTRKEARKRDRAESEAAVNAQIKALKGSAPIKVVNPAAIKVVTSEGENTPTLPPDSHNTVTTQSLQEPLQEPQHSHYFNQTKDVVNETSLIEQRDRETKQESALSVPFDAVKEAGAYLEAKGGEMGLSTDEVKSFMEQCTGHMAKLPAQGFAVQLNILVMKWKAGWL